MNSKLIFLNWRDMFLDGCKKLTLPAQLIKAFEIGYFPFNLKPRNIILNNEGKDYSSLSFQIQDLKIEYREAKVTPKKLGYFVTLWKRNSMAKTEPYSFLESIDYYCFGIACNRNFGQFIFPRNILFENGILSSPTHKGKLGFRLYTPSLKLTSEHAKKTQIWQGRYFLNFKSKKDLYCIPLLFGM